MQASLTISTTRAYIYKDNQKLCEILQKEEKEEVK